MLLDLLAPLTAELDAEADMLINYIRDHSNPFPSVFNPEVVFDSLDNRPKKDYKGLWVSISLYFPTISQ